MKTNEVIILSHVGVVYSGGRWGARACWLRWPGPIATDGQHPLYISYVEPLRDGIAYVSEVKGVH